MKTIDRIVNRIRMDMVKRGDMMSMEDVQEIACGTHYRCGAG